MATLDVGTGRSLSFFDMFHNKDPAETLKNYPWTKVKLQYYVLVFVCDEKLFFLEQFVCFVRFR